MRPVIGGLKVKPLDSEKWNELGVQDAVLLVMANKQDLPNAMSTQDLRKKKLRHEVTCRLPKAPQNYEKPRSSWIFKDIILKNPGF